MASQGTGDSASITHLFDASYAFGPALTLATYNADDFSTDTSKYWVVLTAAF